MEQSALEARTLDSTPYHTPNTPLMSDRKASVTTLHDADPFAYRPALPTVSQRRGSGFPAVSTRASLLPLSTTTHGLLVTFLVTVFLALIVIEIMPGCFVDATGSTVGCGLLGLGVAQLAHGGLITFIVHVLTALPLWGLLCLVRRAARTI